MPEPGELVRNREVTEDTTPASLSTTIVYSKIIKHVYVFYMQASIVALCLAEYAS
jgi:hypothetical protein